MTMMIVNLCVMIERYVLLDLWEKLPSSSCLLKAVCPLRTLVDTY